MCMLEAGRSAPAMAAPAVSTAALRRIAAGHAWPYYVTHPASGETVLERPYVLLCDRLEVVPRHWLGLLDQLAHEQHSLLLLCGGRIDRRVLALLVIQPLGGMLRSAAVALRGELAQRRRQLDELAAFTGACVLLDNADGAPLQRARLGHADRARVGPDTTTIAVSHHDGEPA